MNESGFRSEPNQFQSRFELDMAVLNYIENCTCTFSINNGFKIYFSL